MIRSCEITAIEYFAPLGKQKTLYITSQPGPQGTLPCMFKMFFYFNTPASNYCSSIKPCKINHQLKSSVLNQGTF